MAYLERDEDEEEQAPGGQASAFGSVGGTPTPSAAAPSGGGGSGFVNFDRYFNANANSAEKMGQAAAGQIEANVNAGQAALERGFGQVQDQVTANSGSGGGVEHSAAGWTGKAGTYGGPASFGGTDQFSALKARFEGLGDEVKTAGDQERLQTAYQNDAGKTRASYSQGQSAFDAGLASRGGATAFADLKKRFGDIGNYVDQRAAQGDGLIAGAQTGLAARNAAGRQEADRRNQQDALWGQAQNRQAEAQAQVTGPQEFYDPTMYDQKAEEDARRQEEEDRRRLYDGRNR